MTGHRTQNHNTEPIVPCQEKAPREGRRLQMLPCPAKLSLSMPNPATPRQTRPGLFYPLKRAAGNFLRSSVLPSAAITAHCRTRPHLATPSPAEVCRILPSPIHSPKRAAGRTEILLAAVCNCNRAPPDLALTCRTMPDLTATTLQREQQRGANSPVLPSATIA